MLETLSRRKACVFTTSACLVNTFERRSCAPFRHLWQTRPAGRSDALQHCKLKRALMEAHFLRQSWLSTSSTISIKRTESYLVKYDRVIALRLGRGQRHPVASIARPKQLNSEGTPSQFARLARASNGPAEACPKLFPMLSSAARPSPFQLMNMTYRRDVGQVVFGSVPPKTFPGKSSQLSYPHSTRTVDNKWPCQFR